MKISVSWIREWVDAGDSVQALAHALTMSGLEVEGIEPVAPELSGIVVGEVLEVRTHPEADRLSVCRVEAGSGAPAIVVCGAPNVRAGMKAPFATPGAVLPGGRTIRSALLRGVESHGMLCSARELGLGDDAGGLLELPGSAPTGQDLGELLDLADKVLEIAITPNRGDCMSVVGVAREVAAIRAVDLRHRTIPAVAPEISDEFPVRLEGGRACPKFVARVIRGVRAAARSPLWMRERLRRAGLRPVSAVVDVTNYVMLELGQPMHAYDLTRLDRAIVVRFARTDEQLTLLDGRTVTLDPDVLVIADESRLLGMAGVMGGEESGISDNTTDVLLEVAFFDPEQIAGRGRRYGLVTDASQRFERGVDPTLQERAIERATTLLAECVGGRPGPAIVTRIEQEVPYRAPVCLRPRRVKRVLGIDVGEASIEGYLGRLGMSVAKEPSQWQVSPPPWRFDIAIEEDLIEEVARLHGFDRVPEADAFGALPVVTCTEKFVPSERVAMLLADRGYQEAITYGFVDREWQSALFPGESFLALANPLSEELGVMRVSLWPGLLRTMRDNQRRQQSRVRLFEIGHRFTGSQGVESDVVALAACGTRFPEQWGTEASSLDFFDLKADVEALLALTGEVESFMFRRESHPSLHPGQSARILRGARPVGWIGVLHPRLSQQLDLTYPIILAELDTQSTFAARVPEFSEISRFPAIRRDLAVIVDEAVDLDRLRSEVRAGAGALLCELTVFDVYRGQGVEKGKKSIALGLNMQDTSRTLTDQEADAVVAQVVTRLTGELDATIRDK